MALIAIVRCRFSAFFGPAIKAVSWRRGAEFPCLSHVFGASRFDSKTGRSLLFFWLGPMTSNAALEPLFVLVDDHIHSARLMRRAMQMNASPARVAWIGNARRAERTLARLLGPGATQRPDMVIVDLKSYSGASAAFISRIGNLAAAANVPLAAITDTGAADPRHALLKSGADAVFVRHHDLDAYRAEMAKIIDFWVRETVTWPIRA